MSKMLYKHSPPLQWHLLYPGVQILERTSVQQVLVEKGQVMAVETDRGSIECEYFINCAGQVNLRLGFFLCFINKNLGLIPTYIMQNSV